MTQRLRAWLCHWCGHRWRWETLADNKAAHVCTRCGARQNVRVIEQPPRGDWWQARAKRNKSQREKPSAP